MLKLYEDTTEHDDLLVVALCRSLRDLTESPDDFTGAALWVIAHGVISGLADEDGTIVRKDLNQATKLLRTSITKRCELLVNNPEWRVRMYRWINGEN